MMRCRDMIENAHVKTTSFIWLIVGAVLWIAVPAAIAIIWKVKKKEPVTSILIGAAAFLLFALILEKPIQNVLAFPTAMGLPEHAVSRFLSANPVLLALVAGLFPGVFEETGRLIAFKTVLRKRKNRETSISYGIGHGGFEVILILGLTYIQYIAYAVMLNTGTFGTVVDQGCITGSGAARQYRVRCEFAHRILICRFEHCFCRADICSLVPYGRINFCFLRLQG